MWVSVFVGKNKNTLINLEELVKSHPEMVNVSESFTKDINNMKYELENQEENDTKGGVLDGSKMN